MNSFNHRFWLFGMMYYYAQGGLNDIKFTANTLTEIKRFYNSLTDDCNNVIENPISEFKWKIYDSEQCIWMDYDEFVKQ